MAGIAPWIPVYPANNSAAILGPLPMKQGTVSFPIPTSVVPADATGILVFAWCAVTGDNPGGGYWHVAVDVPGGGQNFFSLIVVGTKGADGVTGFNSQAFWLPMPTDATLNVTLAGSDLPSRRNRGEVEIHGYMPATTTTSD